MKTEVQPDLAAQLATLIDDAADEAHGVQALAALATLLKGGKLKTDQVLALLAAWMYCEPITWESTQDVWSSAEEREANRFPFLQGDLLRCGFVQQVGIAQSEQRHQLWLARTPTCDVVRKPFIQLAPVFPVRNADRGTDLFNALRGAAFFQSAVRFPLPRMTSDDTDVIGYVVDLTEPCFLLGEDRQRATVLQSLSLRGWHLWSLCLKHAETRANMADEIRIRSRGLAQQGGKTRVQVAHGEQSAAPGPH